MNFQAIKRLFGFSEFSFFWTVENRAEKFRCYAEGVLNGLKFGMEVVDGK